MKKTCFLLLIIFVLFSCKTEEKKSEKTIEKTVAKTADVSVLSFDYKGLKPLLHKTDNTVYVVNFWATWCAPCVKELPAFEKINEVYKDKNVEVLLVSLDFPKQVQKRLIPFINNKKIKSKVVLLNDDNEQFWINDIDSTWSGALPATLIYNKNKRKFYEQSFDYKTLQSELETFLN